jgi:hypothetical protein
MFSIITSLISLVGAGVGTFLQSKSADKQVAATEQANTQNAALNKLSLGIEQQNADTIRYSATQAVRSADMTRFQSILDKYPEDKKNVIDIWSGKV